MRIRRVRSIRIPSSRTEFEAELRRHLARLVMSRTEIQGEQIHRERELLEESDAQRSIGQVWCVLAHHRGEQLPITFLLIGETAARVEKVRIEVPHEMRPRPRPVDIPIPAYLSMDPRLGFLRGQRERLLGEITRIETRLRSAEQEAAYHGSINYPNQQSGSEQVGRAVASAGIALGRSDDTTLKTNSRIEHRVRREFEAQAQAHQNTLDNLHQQLQRLNTEITEREREAERLPTHIRIPGVVGVCQ